MAPLAGHCDLGVRDDNLLRRRRVRRAAELRELLMARGDERRADGGALGGPWLPGPRVGLAAPAVVLLSVLPPALAAALRRPRRGAGVVAARPRGAGLDEQCCIRLELQLLLPRGRGGPRPVPLPVVDAPAVLGTLATAVAQQRRPGCNRRCHRRGVIARRRPPPRSGRVPHLCRKDDVWVMMHLLLPALHWREAPSHHQRPWQPLGGPGVGPLHAVLRCPASCGLDLLPLLPAAAAAVRLGVRIGRSRLGIDPCALRRVRRRRQLSAQLLRKLLQPVLVPQAEASSQWIALGRPGGSGTGSGGAGAGRGLATDTGTVCLRLPPGGSPCTTP
mmetsp:Transcript_95320/g.238911  ORF Transcript_95320/g.238911 Transcript_95320/m.238911 type:complete len:332 (+) Transcript_95320:378-1373(+)